MTIGLARVFFALLGMIAAHAAFANDPNPSNDFDEICPNASLPVEPGDLPVNPGMLWNPERSGTGWTIAFSPIGPNPWSNGRNIHLIWYTYRADGTPVWYLSDPTAIESSNGSPGTFAAPLYEYKWTASAAANQRVSKLQNPIGLVKGYFSSRDQSRLALEWQLTGDQGFTPECLIDFSREFHPDPSAALRSIGPQPLGVNLAFNGAYYNNANPGWGMLQHIVRTDGEADQSLYRESVALALYNSAGQATWVLGLDGQQDGSISPPPVGYPATLALSVYRASSQFNPRAKCSEANSSCTATASATGSWTRTFLDSETLDARLDLTENGHQISFAGFDYRSPPEAGQTQSSPIARLTRLTENNYIVVDRAPCVAFPGQSTCNVSINWSLDPAEAGSVCVRRKETIGASSSWSRCLSDTYTHHGEIDVAIDPLTFGPNSSNRLQYALTSTANSTSPADFSVYVSTPVLYAVSSTFEDPLATMNDAQYPGGEAEAPHTPGLTRLPGAAGVSGGAATYSVPIEVPPGRRGMQPSVSLEYSSRAGNGIAGMGFSMSAGGSIHRCPKTLEQDGVVRAVRLDNQDRLCLDGQRLRVVEGTYGTSNAVYATEIDSFVRVRQLGGDLSHLATYFEVRTKDGEVRTYGKPAFMGDAGALVRPRRLEEPAGELSPLSWMLAERRDTLGAKVGNTERYIYAGSFPESSAPNAQQIPEVLLTEIRYTGYRNDTFLTEGNRSVKFVYEARPDRGSSFIGGGVLWQAQRLSRVETYAPDSAVASGATPKQVRTYQLSYSDDPTQSAKTAVPKSQLPPEFAQTSLSSGRSLLRSITERAHDDDGSFVRSPTEFTWQDGLLDARERSTSELVGANAASGLINGNAPVRVVGDFNGDGHRDLLARGANGESILLTLGASRQVIEAIDVTAALGGTGIDDGRISSNWFVDVDLDARQDLLGYEVEATRPVEQDVELVVYRSRADAKSSASFDEFFPMLRRKRTGITGPASELVGQQSLVDFNGDGYPDILWRRKPNSVSGCANAAFTLLLNDRTGGFQAPTAGVSVCLGEPFAGQPIGSQLMVGTEDVNGDGVIDLVLGTNAGGDGGWSGRGTWSSVRLGSLDTNGNYVFGSQSRLGVIFPAEGEDPSLEQLWGANRAPQLFQRGDFNGDGLLDIVWAGKKTVGGNLEWVFRLNTGAGFGPKIWSGRTDGLVSRGPTELSRAPINGSLIRITDTNADGRDELVIPTGFAQLVCQRFYGNPEGNAQPQTAGSGSGAPPAQCTSLVDAGRPDVLVHPNRRFHGCLVDIDEERASGPPEELYACPEHPITGLDSFVPNQPSSGGNFARFIDTQGDGVGGEDFRVVGMYARGYGAHNSSTYTYSAIDLSFAVAKTPSGPGATNSVALDVQFSQPRALPQAFVPEEDLFSDGLADGLGATGCRYSDSASCSRLHVNNIAPGSASTVPSHNHYPGQRRFHFSESRGVGSGGTYSLGAPMLPDLLSSVTEPVAGAYGAANVFEWLYSPLSGLADRGAGDLPLYSLQPPAGDAGSYADTRHFYFTSSMPVVAEFSRPAGVRDAQGQPLQNTTLYGYGQAIYHVFGRGFQGFRSIHEWDLAQGTALETVFHQRFPLTSRIERQTLSVLRINDAQIEQKPLSKTSNTWACELGNRGACPINGEGWGLKYPFLDKEVVETFDAALAEAGTGGQPISRRTVTYANWSGLTPDACPTGSAASAGYDIHGNLLYKFEVLEDLGSGAKLAKACSMEQHDYLAADATPAVWWVNRLHQSTQQRRVQYSTQHAPPTGVATSDVNPQQSRRSVFSWNPTTRLLEQQTEQLIGTSTEVLTSSNFFYPGSSAFNCAGAPVSTGAHNYGLPNCVRVTRGSEVSGGDSAGLSLATASPESRETATTYSSDGYFPTAVRNALGHRVSTVTRPRDGQPSEATDANGLKTRMEYDAFGFLQRTRYPQLSGTQNRQPDVAVGLQACGTAGVNCAGIADAFYRQQTSALGAPTRMQYFDALGREIASEAEAATADMVAAGSPRFVRSGVFHNRRGLVTRQAAPFAISGFGAAAPGWPDAYTEFSDFDVLGRARMKREHNMKRVGIAQPDSTHPLEQEIASDRVTRYTFNGRVTSISAYAERNGVQSGKRTLSREVDGLGRHLITADAHESNPNATGGITRYWFDAWGQPVAIKDAKDAVTRAVHDAAGRRRATHDPNQGISTYLYSGFGELLRQVDARGVKQDFYYDTLGRQVRRRMSLTSTSCNFANPEALQVSAEYDRDCASTTDDYFFFDGVIDRGGQIGSASAKGMPSGHERLITSLTIPHSERRVWDTFDGYGRVVARNTVQNLKAKNGPLTHGGTRQYVHRYKYDSRYGRLLGESWPNGVGRGFRYSSIGAVQAETGHGDGMPGVLREVSQVNVLGLATEEWLGDRTVGAALRSQRRQTLATGELESIDYARSASGTGGSAAVNVWQETYRYDAFGNLVRRAQHQWDGGNHSAYDAYHYDLLHRMTQSTLRPFANGVAQASTPVNLAYDVVGNLLKKTDFSDNLPDAYSYPSASAGRPNAVSQVRLPGTAGTRAYRYDGSGNVVCQYKVGNGSSCSSAPEFDAYYNHNHQPVHQRRLASGTGTNAAYSLAWYSYGADQQPARQWGLEGDEGGCRIVRGVQLPPECFHHRIHLDRYEDSVGLYRDFQGSVRQYRTRAYVGDYLVATRGHFGELELSFLLRDRLGSVVGVERAHLSGRRIEAMVAETRHGFDAYGAPRGNRKWSGNAWVDEGAWTRSTRTQQGFTGHERLAGLKLIHMKGRVFDPVLGRFHGVDPVIQFPLSSQGLNPYSYILNNPMAGVDPTGYSAKPTAQERMWAMAGGNGTTLAAAAHALDAARTVHSTISAQVYNTSCGRIACANGASNGSNSFGVMREDGLPEEAADSGPSPSFATRALGVGRIAVGAVEIAGGAYVCGQTVGAGCWAGAALAALGGDQIVTGAQEAWYGVPHETLVTQLAMSAGADVGTARMIDLGVNLGAGGWAAWASGSMKFAPMFTGQGSALATNGALPSAGGMVRQFEQVGDRVYYRVFSGDASVGGWLTAVPPRGSAWAQEALALPPSNKATMIQEVLVPNGTLLQRSRAIPMPEWGRLRGGAEQFKLLDEIPIRNFGPGRPLQ